MKSPVKAIREFCRECTGGDLEWIRNCPSDSCSLYPFRMGKDPRKKRNLTDEQKKVFADRLRHNLNRDQTLGTD